MEFYHLRSFVVVAKAGNLTSAAKQLCTTPPAISAHIKSLEEELKTTLFTRSSKGMHLTEKGKLLLPQAEQTLGSAIHMVNLAAENQNEIIGEFKLSINQSAKQLNIPTLLDNVQENCPGISINLESLSSGAAIKLLHQNLIDGAFVYSDVDEDSELSRILIKEQDITTIAPFNTQLNIESLLHDIAQHSWVTMGDNCPFDHALQLKLKKIIRANINTSDDNTRLTLVKSNYGLSFLEKEEAIQAENLHHVKVLPQLDFQMKLYFVVKSSRAEEPVIKAIIQEVKIQNNIKD